jgi:hypothetical protein
MPADAVRVVAGGVSPENLRAANMQEACGIAFHQGHTSYEIRSVVFHDPFAGLRP